MRADGVLTEPLPIGQFISAQFITGHARVALIGGLMAPIILHDGQFQTLTRLGRSAEILRRCLWRSLPLLGVLLAVNILLPSRDATPTFWVMTWATGALAITIGGRGLLLHTLRRLGRHGRLSERVALVGCGPLADRLIRHLRDQCGPGFEIVGVFDEDPALPGAGTLDDLLALGSRQAIDWVMLALPPSAETRLPPIVARLKALDAKVAFCPTLALPALVAAGLPAPARRIEQLGDLPVVLLAGRAIERWGLVLKLLEDKILASVLLLLLLPVILAAALAIRLDSPGPVIFRQRRHGWNNTEFEVFKLRTMTWPGQDATGDALAAGAGQVRQTTRADKRVTRVGRVLRHTSIDELPQLLNVLLGQMSLVGPRPHPVGMRTQNRLGNDIIAEYAHRHRVKPGITGWAQVNGLRGATETAEEVRQRIEHDLYYIENWSILFDFKILALTPLAVIFRNRNAF